jgi:small subunit ribosomal protein S4
MMRRAYPPGMHGMASRRLSEYGKQLREMQKAADIFFINEGQMRKYYNEATRSKGGTGETLIRLLETRLDNTVYRLGFADARATARQLVLHGLISVNDKKINLPSYRVKVKDKIAFSAKGIKSKYFETRKAALAKVSTVPGWLKLDEKNLTGEVLSMPTREQMESSIDESLIVEYYSR